MIVWMERNNPARAPGVPDSVVDTTKGVKVEPSNSAADAFPNDESVSVPETIRTRSDSIMLLPSCVFCRGTMVNCATSVVPWRVPPRIIVSKS